MSTGDDRGRREIDLVLAYQANPSPSTSAPLLDSIDNLISKATNQISKPNLRVPRPVVRGVVMNTALSLLKNTYDPSKGSKPSTYLYPYLVSNSKSEIFKFQNVVRIRSTLGGKVKGVLETREELLDRLGREPSSVEISQALGIPPKDVERILSQSSQKDYVGSQSDQQTVNPYSSTVLAWDSMYTELSREEQAVADLLKRNTPITQISTMMGKPRSEINRIRQRVADRFQTHLNRI
jgi:DNA-directed RNA polymerase specialized sigma subunit